MVVYNAYRTAYLNRSKDWKECTTMAQADGVATNVDKLETLYLKAGKQALNATGNDVENAYRLAKSAQDEVENAYKQAVALAERIRLVGQIAGKVGDLISKAK